MSTTESDIRVHAAKRSMRLLGLLLMTCAALAARAAETFDIGRTSNGARIDAAIVEGSSGDAPLVVLVGGLAGEDASVAAVRSAVERFDALPQGRRGVTLIAIPLANPDGAPLAFPPTGKAYRENAEANTLWRFIGAHGPDLVLIAGHDDFGLGAALEKEPVALVGRIPSRRFSSGDDLAALGADSVMPSEAHRELDRRRARTPRELALELGEMYGREFDRPWYIEALALRAQLELGRLEEVRKLVEPYVSGEKNSLERPNSLVMAGHLIFGDLARATGDPRYVAMVRKVADLGFDEKGNMLESMPYHGEYSDSVFMGTVSLAQAGALTGERKYFDMAVRHLKFMAGLDLRPDGLYRHQPVNNAAWGRGNGFAALGIALVLSDLPKDHPAYADVLGSYRALMAALLPYQNRDGLWRNVVDVPGAYPEFTGTAMIGFAMQRGLKNGWLEDEQPYQAAVARAWDAVNARTGPGGTFIDVCESTANVKTLEGYLDREAILGPDPRAGAMAMIFATELMQ
ncbi:MAG TPA: glycoside hydrolase family 88 protein [Gammaproteobacteria bacterium]|nr:glycoside hydrolase family 88 protein [Gammaproteobacteria bacterium]